MLTKTKNSLSKKNLSKNMPNILLGLFMLLVAVAFFFPIYCMVIISFKPIQESIFTPLSFPTHLYVQNFIDAWNMLNLGQVYFNSVVISLCAVFGRIFFASMCSFSLAKCKTKYNAFLYMFFLSGLMIPGYTVLVPLIRLMKNLGLLNSRLGMIVYYVSGGMAFAIFMLTGFIRSIPNELLDAANIDGCSVFKTYRVIILPLIKPALSTLFILDLLAIWNDFLMPMLVLTDSKLKTVTVAMYNFYGEYGSRWEMTFAGYSLAILPIVILYLFLQKNIVSGIMSGAVKG